MIPASAIEAACRAEFSDWDTNGDDWWRGMTRKRMQKALEAAAPHMLAQAWDSGVNAGRTYPADAKSRNPYRPTP